MRRELTQEEHLEIKKIIWERLLEDMERERRRNPEDKLLKELEESIKKQISNIESETLELRLKEKKSVSLKMTGEIDEMNKKLKLKEKSRWNYYVINVEKTLNK